MTTVDSSSVTHICPKCGEEKPLTNDFFRYKIKNDKKYFYKYGCKSCLNSEQKENAREYARKKRATPEGLLKARQSTAEFRKRAKEKDINAWRLVRQEEARRKAEREGRSYQSREELAVKRIIYSGSLNAKKTLKAFLASSSDEEMACWYAALGTPWFNPRLSPAEKHQLRYRGDPEYHAYHILKTSLNKKKELYPNSGTTIRNALVGRGKGRKIEVQLGYTITKLRNHIERQFTKGMTWDKFLQGEIHIDHIQPRSSFNLHNADEWRSCWSLSNLRPMWAKDNRAKSAKITHLL